MEAEARVERARKQPHAVGPSPALREEGREKALTR